VSAEARARAAYEAFVSARGGIPRWSDLDESEKAAWRASAAACRPQPAAPGEAKPRAFGLDHGKVTRFDDGDEE
jgi:hypothetical protein